MKARRGGKIDVQVRGANRRKQLEKMGDVLRGEDPESLFRKPDSLPVLWMKEFQVAVADFLSPALKQMQEQVRCVGIMEALKNPEKNQPLLGAAFSAVMQAWIGDDAGQSLLKLASIEMKAMLAEVLLEVRTANVKHRMKLKATDLWADLILQSMVTAKDAPRPFADFFCIHLAVFLGRLPLPSVHRNPEIDEAFKSGMDTWQVLERAGHPNFMLCEQLQPSVLELNPVKRYTIQNSQADFKDISRLPLERFKTWKTLWGQSATISDPRFYPPFAREFGTNARRIQRVDDREVDISNQNESLHILLNKFPPQAAVAQMCCTQEFYQMGLCILQGDDGSKSPMRDKAGRQFTHVFGSLPVTYVIERQPDDSLEITCRFTNYEEQVKLMSWDTGDRTDTNTRLVLPGWMDIEMKAKVSMYGGLELESIIAETRNLQVLDAEPDSDAQDNAEKEQDERKSSNKGWRTQVRKSMKFKRSNSGDQDLVELSPRATTSRNGAVSPRSSRAQALPPGASNGGSKDSN